MDSASFDYFSWIVLPVLIFFSRLADVSLATLRHIFVSKGFRKIVPYLGFVEVMIWLIAMRQVFNHLDNIACFIAWAAGFAMGTRCGMWLEERMALGTQIIRIITPKDCTELIEELKNHHHGLTRIEGQGSSGPVTLLFMIVKRVNKTEILSIIHHHQPDAFYTVEDVRASEHGVFSKDQDRNVFIRMMGEKRK